MKKLLLPLVFAFTFLNGCTSCIGTVELGQNSASQNAAPILQCWQCEIYLSVYGRGTVRVDTLCSQTAQQIEQFSQSQYISNDSVQRIVTCHPVLVTPNHPPYPNE